MSNSPSLEQSQNAFLSMLLVDSENIGHKQDCNVNPAERLTIYQKNYQQALYCALSDTYALTKTLLSDSQFHEFMSAYIQKHPSIDENLNLYGDSFSKFLYERDQSQTIADLANYEYQRLLCYYAANSPVFAAGIFDSMDLDSKLNQGFIKQESVVPVKCNFDLLGFIENQATPSTSHEYVYALYREVGKVKLAEIEHDEYKLLNKFKATHSLQTLSENELALLPNLIVRNWLMMVETKV